MNFHKNGASEKGERWCSTEKKVGLTNEAGEGIWGSSRLDTTGNPLSPCSCNTTLFHYLISHTRELEKQVLCEGRGEWAAEGWCLPYPNKETRATWWWNPQSLSLWCVSQGKSVLPLNYHSRLERENLFLRLVKLRHRSPKVFLQHPHAQDSEVLKISDKLKSCLNPVDGWTVTTHYAA